MQVPPNRSIVIISGLLTLLVLGGGTLAVGFHNGWLRTASDARSLGTAVASAQSTPTRNDRDATVLLTHGDERFTDDDGDKEHRGRRSRQSESHDE